MNKKQIEDKFKNKKITQIENEIDKDMKASSANEKEFMIKLIYLNMTCRYKENPEYRNETFENYIHDRFNMTTQMFYKKRKIYLKYEKETEKYGPGIVGMALNKCGDGKIKSVFMDIELSQSRSKKPVTRELITEIIENHKKERKNRKPSLAELKTQLENTRQSLQESVKEKAELIAQIGKLKLTNTELKTQVKELKSKLNRGKTAIKNTQKIFSGVLERRPGQLHG